MTITPSGLFFARPLTIDRVLTILISRMISLPRAARFFPLSRRTLSLVGLLAILLAVPLSVYLALQRQETRSRAQTTAANGSTKPEYASGEVLVKFRSKTPQLKQETIKAQSADFDKGPVGLSEVDENTLPLSLKKFSKRYTVDKLEKVFKGVGTPAEEINKLKERLPADEFSTRKINQKELEQVDLSKIYKLSFDKNIPIEVLVRELRRDPDVVYVEPNFVYKTTQLDFKTATSSAMAPNDPYYRDSFPDNVGNRDPNWNPSYDYQWNLKKIRMEQAWNTATPSAQALVAVIDTGVDYTHPELGGCTLEQVRSDQCQKVAPGFDFINNDDDPLDDNNHGTHVAGTIASVINNDRGIAGIAPNARIVPLKALDEYGSGQTNGLALAIYAAVSRGARVINASWGGYGDSQVLTDAINFAYLNGVVFVTAAGNDNIDTARFFPANITCITENNPDLDCTITVASTDQGDNKSSFSNWGTMIDLSAPGGDISGNVLSIKASQGKPMEDRMVGAEYVRMSGTSMAAPHVSALAAMVLGKNASFTAEQVRNILINGADDLGTPYFDNRYGYGRINTERTLLGMDISTPSTAKISSPLRGFLVGKKFKVYGSAYGNGFSRFSIEHSTSAESTSWSAQGVLLEGGGNSIVRNGLLATVDLSNEPDGTHYLRLTTISDKAGSFIMVPIRIDGSIRNNFPIPFGSWISSQKPTVADIDTDGKKEILFKSYKDMKVYAIQPDGTNLPGWPKSTGESPGGWYAPNSPIVVDIDPSYSGLEVIVAASFREGIASLAFHADGTEVSGWTTQDWERRDYLYKNMSGELSSIVINGQDAVVYAEWGRWSSERPGRIHALGRDGSELPGWPIDIDDGASIWLAPVIADVDNDGNAEIIVDYAGRKIRIYSNTGTLKKEVQINSGDGGYINNIAAVDLDSDGFFEIIATTIDHSNFGVGSVSVRGGGSSPTTISRVYAWDHAGNLKSNKFPVVLQDAQYLYDDLLTVGDFNSDSYPEILTFLSDKYYLIDKDGNFVRGFPASGLTSYYGGPSLAANITLSNSNHLLAAAGAHYWSSLDLYEYNPASGVLSRSAGYPKDFGSASLGLLGATGSPSVIDTDGDGKLEIIAPAELGWDMNSSYLYVFDSGYSAKFLDWPQYLHDERHTGAYKKIETGVRVPLAVKVLGIGSASGENNSPVGRSKTVTITIFDVNNVYKKTATVDLQFDGNNFVGTAELGDLLDGMYKVAARSVGGLSVLVGGEPINIGGVVSPQSIKIATGDADGNDRIDAGDQTKTVSCYGSSQSSSNWNNCQSADFNDDGRVSVTDYSAVVTNYGSAGYLVSSGLGGSPVTPVSTSAPVPAVTYIDYKIGCGNPNGLTPDQICKQQGFDGAAEVDGGKAAKGYWWKQCGGASVSDCKGISCTVDKLDCTKTPGWWGSQQPYPSSYTKQGGASTNYKPTELGFSCRGYNPGWTMRVACSSSSPAVSTPAPTPTPTPAPTPQACTLKAIIAAFRSKAGDARFNSACDFKKDGVINVLDYVRFLGRR